MLVQIEDGSLAYVGDARMALVDSDSVFTMSINSSGLNHHSGRSLTKKQFEEVVFYRQGDYSIERWQSCRASPSPTTVDSQ
jgi:hypothetical protein